MIIKYKKYVYKTKFKCYNITVNKILYNLFLFGGKIMKRFLALIAVLVLATSFSVVSFAASSPSGETKHTVTITSNKGGSNKSNYKMVKKDDGTVVLTAVKGESTFLRWNISGKYKIVSGSLKSGRIVIRPLSDLKVKMEYDIKGSGKPGDGGSTSPQTGSRGITALGLTMIAALAFSAISKKELAK